ncbi:hypothetical protein [Deinococcus sp. PESE-13]
MKKNIALLALTGVLTLASCGQSPTPADTTAPSVTFAASPSSLASNGGSVTLSGTAKDDSGIASVVITRTDGGTACTATVDASGAFSCTTSVAANTSSTAPATYTYQVVATDKASTPNKTTVTSNVVTVAAATPAIVNQVLTVNLTGVGSAPITIKDSSTGTVVAGYDNVKLDNGAKITLKRGVYLVIAGQMEGKVQPGAQTVDLSADRTVSFTYANVPGVAQYKLTVNFQGVASAPLTIKDAKTGSIVAGYENVSVANGTAITLNAGDYLVIAGNVNGYTAPVSQTISLSSDKAATFAYAQVVASEYALTVSVSGVESVPVTISDVNGFVLKTITVKGSQKVSLRSGTYLIKGAAVEGFNAPEVKTIVVGASDTGVTLTYTPVVTPVSTDILLTPAQGDNNKVLSIAQQIEGNRTEVPYVRGTIIIDPQQANNGADRIEVFTSATTNDINAANRIYDSRDSSGLVTLDTSKLRQGELQYIIVRYWQGTSNFLRSILFIPDNLGPQVADVIPVSKLNPELTQKLGNWANGTITLAFQNLDTLRDNPVGTSYWPSGVERVEWYADATNASKNGVADIATAKLIGTAYKSPYQVSVDTKTLADGAHDIYAVAYDQLGNRSVVLAQNLFVLNVDNTGPVVNGNGNIVLVDAGTGAVRDEFSKGGITATYTRRDNGTCLVDALGDDAGNIDLYDSVATDGPRALRDGTTAPAGTQFISGLARVRNLTYSNSIADAGVGVANSPSGERFITVDGQPLVNRLYTLGTDGRLTALTALRQVTTEPPLCSNVFMDVNGLDAGAHTVRFNTGNATTDLLGNPATGGGINDVTFYVDNQRPSNLRFSKKPLSVPANGQATLAAEADDSVSGLRGAKEFFARDTNGTAFNGRAVQLASADQLNYRFFQPTSGNLDLIATVRDFAGNVSSNTETIAVTSVGSRLVTLNNDNLFVRRQQANGQFLNFNLATDENPVLGPVGTVHSLDLLNYGRNANAFAETNVLAGNFYQEVLLGNPLSRIGKGTADLNRDDLNIQGDQAHAPLYLISSTESAPFTSVKALENGLFAYHAATIDKNGWVSEVIRSIRY